MSSATDELPRGITDGSYKQVVKDRGGLVETGAWEHRRQLSVPLYGMVELAEKQCPGTDTARMPLRWECSCGQPAGQDRDNPPEPDQFRALRFPAE